MQKLIDMTTPGKVRTFMIVDAANGEANITQYGNKEAEGVFGADVMALVNKGERAIWHNRHSKNMVVFDVVLAAVTQNADLFTKIRCLYTL